MENKISSTVSNHGVMACLSVFHVQNILHRDRSISLYVSTSGKELNVLARPPSFLKNLQKKKELHFSFCVKGDIYGIGMASFPFVVVQKCFRNIIQEGFLMHTCSICLRQPASCANTGAATGTPKMSIVE